MEIWWVPQQYGFLILVLKSTFLSIKHVSNLGKDISEKNNLYVICRLFWLNFFFFFPWWIRWHGAQRTVPKTYSSPLKMGHPKRKLVSFFSGTLAVRFTEDTFKAITLQKNDDCYQSGHQEHVLVVGGVRPELQGSPETGSIGIRGWYFGMPETLYRKLENQGFIFIITFIISSSSSSIFFDDIYTYMSKSYFSRKRPRRVPSKRALPLKIVIKDCHQTSPKVLLKWWLSLMIVIKDCPKFCWRDGCL